MQLSSAFNPVLFIFLHFEAFSYKNNEKATQIKRLLFPFVLISIWMRAMPFPSILDNIF